MHEEKKIDSLRWVSNNDLKFRIHKIDEESSVLWASILGVDLCFTLMFYDFLDRVRESLNLNLEIDTSWKGLRGFKVKNSEVDLLMGQIVDFVIEWEIEANENADRLSDEEWYSI